MVHSEDDADGGSGSRWPRPVRAAKRALTKVVWREDGSIESVDEGASGDRAPAPEGGPDGHLNWRCFDAGLPVGDTVEIALYSDAHLRSHGEMGPYRLINTVPTDANEALPMTAILRMDWSVPDREPLPDLTKSDQSTFHGGGLPEEIAALASLAMGIRLQAGGVVREFRDPHDPKGQPVQHGHRRPILPTSRERIIPSLASGDLAHVEPALRL
jgi:hypothetical protein